MREYERKEIWSPDSRTVWLTFTLSARGHLHVEASLQGEYLHAELRVRLHADQSYLSTWIRAVGEVVERIRVYL